MKSTKLLTSSEDFFRMLGDDTILVDDAYLLGDDVLQVSYNKKSQFQTEAHCSNVVIAAYVTAYARLKLYDELTRLQERCIYYDTDSIIFYAANSDYIPQTGVYLGEFTNELATSAEPDAYITKFISCGPKNYCYEVYYPIADKREYVCKVKGITMNFETQYIVNFDSMKKIIDEYLNGNEQNLEVPQLTFHTNDYNEVSTLKSNKLFRLVYDKRVLLENYYTIPFGYA